MFMALKLGLEPKAVFLLIVNELCHFFGKAKKEFWLSMPWSALSRHTSLCRSMGCCLASNHMTGSPQVVSIVLHPRNKLNELCQGHGWQKFLTEWLSSLPDPQLLSCQTRPCFVSVVCCNQVFALPPACTLTLSLSV